MLLVKNILLNHLKVKKSFFELRDLHETIFIDNYVKNYHGSELYRKVVKIIEMNGLWERDWRRSRNIRIV
jgi:hypothetical protein